MKAAVIGAAGYAGGELLRLLLQHPEISAIEATSRSQAGRLWGEVHPGVAPLTDAAFSDAAPADAAARADVAFLCLEHGGSSALAREVLSAGPRLVVDIAADFRIADPELYRTYYGAHADPSLLPSFVYGLADIVGEELRGARAIAAPGCFATAAQLALFPLAPVGAELGDALVTALFGITGSSGAGVQPRPTTHHPARANNVFAYSPLGHRHEGEVLQRWRSWTGRPAARTRLMTHSGPFVRGIYLTLHAQAPAGTFTGERAPARLYADAYAGRRFVRLLDVPPEVTHVAGTNDARIFAIGTPDGAEAQVSVAIDNLVKGAAGQAVQAMNLALGFPEDAGLRLAGAFPC